MEGKTIKGSFDFSGDDTLLMFDDGTAALVKVVNIELAEDEVKELVELLGGSGEPEKKKTPAKEKKKAPAKGKKKELTYADIAEMDHDELSKVVKAHELDVDPEDFDEDEEKEMADFLEEVADELDLGAPKEKDGASDDKYTWDDLAKMDYEELEDLVDEEDLEDEIDTDDFDEDTDGDEDKLRAAIAKELEIPVPAKTKKKKKK